MNTLRLARSTRLRQPLFSRITPACRLPRRITNAYTRIYLQRTDVGNTVLDLL